MAITIGAAVKQSDTQTTHISDAGAITAGSFNAGTITALTPTDDVYTADLVLDVQLASAPAIGGAFYLYRRDLNIDGANDAPVPNTDYEHTYIGSFPTDDVATRQYIPYKAAPITEDQEFYIKNDTGVSTAGTTVLKATPNTPNAKV